MLKMIEKATKIGKFTLQLCTQNKVMNLGENVSIFLNLIWDRSHEQLANSIRPRFRLFPEAKIQFKLESLPLSAHRAAAMDYVLFLTSYYAFQSYIPLFPKSTKVFPPITDNSAHLSTHLDNIRNVS
jgi:hypothetical protein